MSRKISMVALLCGAMLVAYLLFWPVEISPGAWAPPAAPGLVGPFEANDKLRSAVRLGADVGRAPEDIAIGVDGRIYAGFEDGRIVRFAADGASHEVFANTDGRPLGLEFDAQQNLIVADSYKGLLSISQAGDITVLATEHGGKRFGFTDDLDIAGDGVIYFSDASWKFGQTQYMEDIIEHQPNGRMLAYDPASNTVRLVMDGLYFANGVAVAPDDSFVLVAETGKYRVLRYWLKGEKQGTTEVFIENLPGFPDGVTTGEAGRFWVALAAPRDATLDALLPRPFVRKVIMRIPAFLRPQAARYSHVLALDADARVTQNLQDPGAVYAPITNVREHAGQLYFGSIEEMGFGRYTMTTGK